MLWPPSILLVLSRRIKIYIHNLGIECKLSGSQKGDIDINPIHTWIHPSINGQLKHPASCQATWTAANLGRQGWIWEIWSNTLLSEPAMTCCPLRMPRHSYLHKAVWVPHSTIIIDHFLWFGVDGALTMVTVVWRPTHTSSKNISNHVSNSLPRQLSLSHDSIKTVNVTLELRTQEVC